MDIRKFAIAALDDDYGINEKGYDILRDALFDAGHEDILKAVDACEGRFYLKCSGADLTTSSDEDSESFDDTENGIL